MRVGSVFLQTAVLQGFRLVTGVCRAKLMATTLGPAGVGIFAQAQNLQSLIMAAGSLSLATGYVQRIRYLSGRYDEPYRQEIHGSIYFTVLASLAVLLLGLTPFLPWIEAKAFSGTVAPGFIGFILWSVPFLSLAQMYFEPRLIASERYGDYVKATCAASLLGVGVLWVLLKAAGPWALSLFLFGSSVLSFAFMAGFTFFQFGGRALLPLGWRWSHLRPVLKVSAALVVTGLAFYGTAVWLRSLVLRHLGADYAGFIQVPIVMSGYYTPLLSHVIWNVYHVRLSETPETEKNGRMIAASLGFVMLLQPLITLWIMTFPGIAVGLIYTDDFRHGINTFPLQFIGDFFYFLLTVLSVKILARNRIRLYTALWLVFSLLEAAAGAYFILELKLALRSLAAAYLVAAAGTFALFFWAGLGRNLRASPADFRFTPIAFLLGFGFLLVQAQLLRMDAELFIRFLWAATYTSILGGLLWVRRSKGWASRLRELLSGDT